MDNVQGIETGKCVVVLTLPDSAVSLCCASIGPTGKLACFKPVSECVTASQAGSREKNRELFVPGIYLIASGTARRVFHQPVGEVELMNSHSDAILDCEESCSTS